MRPATERKADALAKLEGDANVWVATADAGGRAHLVPLSLCWFNDEVVVAVETRSRTARNLAASGQARLALGATDDVVMIDVADVTVVARADAEPALADAYRRRTGWDPGEDSGEWVFVRCRPARIQVWRSVEEITGRTVMRDGAWLP